MGPAIRAGGAHLITNLLDPLGGAMHILAVAVAHGWWAVAIVALVAGAVAAGGEER